VPLVYACVVPPRSPGLLASATDERLGRRELPPVGQRNWSRGDRQDLFRLLLPSEMARWMLPPGSTTVVGGGSPAGVSTTGAQRMADALKRAGHQIVFVEASGLDHASV
jgi:hypothetical protein